MAQIVEVELPEEYINKNKYEIYTHLEQVSIYAHKLKEQIEDLQAEIKLRDLQLQKQRADILKLKSYVGHQNIKIKDLELESDNFIEVSVEEEKETPNFIPASLPFEEVQGKINKI